METKKSSCGKEFKKDGFDFRCGERHSYGGYDYCPECQKNHTQEKECNQ